MQDVSLSSPSHPQLDVSTATFHIRGRPLWTQVVNARILRLEKCQSITKERVPDKWTVHGGRGMSNPHPEKQIQDASFHVHYIFPFKEGKG